MILLLYWGLNSIKHHFKSGLKFWQTHTLRHTPRHTHWFHYYIVVRLYIPSMTYHRSSSADDHFQLDVTRANGLSCLTVPHCIFQTLGARTKRITVTDYLQIFCFADIATILGSEQYQTSF